MQNRGTTDGRAERKQPDETERTQPTKVPDRQSPEGDDKRHYGNTSEKSGRQPS